MFIVASLLVGLLASFAQPVFAADLTGTWVKTDQGLTALRVGTSLYFNPGKEGTHWYMTENAAGVKCQSKVEFSDNPLTNADAAKSGTQRFYKEVAEGAGTTGCLEKTGDANKVTISGTPGGATTDPGNGAGTGAGATATPKCDVGGLSFAICPLINFMADATEWTAHVLQSILYIQPLPLNGSNDLFTAWASILTIANVVLAIAFVFVIFSQATSMALSSYGIKKMLPRIIAAAILMNLSYYICALMVDLSNLAGVGISGFFAGILNGNIFTDPSKTLSNSFGNHTITEVAAGAGVGAIIIFFFLVPVLLAALAVLFTLAARIAIIVLLVMVAPLAFAAWVLPNTEKYFKKWYELFFNMLMIFPLVMGTFAAAAVASQLIQSTTIQGVNPDGATGDFAKTVLLPLIALLVQAMPLFALPFLFKVAGGTLGRINAMTQSRVNQGFNASRKRYQESGIGKYRAARKDEDQRLAQTGSYNGWRPGRRLQSATNRKLNRSKVFNAATRGYGGFRTLDEARQTREDQGKTQEMLSGDFDLAEAWVADKGSKGKAYNALTRAQQQKFEQMRRAGYHERASSYSAALSLMADSGKGTPQDIQSTMDKIDELTPNKEQAGVAQAGLNEYIRSAYRKSGRGDLVVRDGVLNTQDKKLALSGYGDRKLDKDGNIQAMGWDEISMPNLTRHAIDSKNTAGRASFQTWVQQRPENLRKVVASLDSMEQRARVEAEGALSGIGYNDMDALRVQFGLRQGSSGTAGGQNPQGPTGGNSGGGNGNGNGGGTPTGGGGGNNGGNGGGNAGGGTTIFNGGFPTGGGSAPAGGGATAAPASNAAPQSAAPPQNLGNQTFTGSAPAAQPPVVQQVNVQQQAPQFTAAYSPGSLRASSPTTINNIISNAGGAQNLSEGDITRITEAAQDRPELANIHDEMLRERRRRMNEPDRSESGAIIMPPSPGGFQGETNINHDNRQ